MQTEHPVFIRARAKAAELGSKAQTIPGVAKFLKANPQKRWARPLSGNHAARAWWRVTEWQAKVAERKSNPEFKRALRDRDFGLAFAGKRLREIKKDHARILAGNPAEADLFVRDLPKRLETINQIRAAHGQRLAKFAHQLTKVSFTAGAAEEIGVKLCKRGKDWEVAATFKPDYFHHEDGETEWKKGVPKAYARATNITYVRSFAGLISDRALVYFFSRKVNSITLPEGYFWNIDQNNELRVVKSDSTKDDFHPMGDILIENNAAFLIVEQLEQNRQLRLELAAREAAALAEMQGVYVCVADSRRAGNCDAGTLSFAHRHGLDAARHYAASELVGIANGDAGRVRLAITSAVHRHHKEVARGYSILGEHK